MSSALQLGLPLAADEEEPALGRGEIESRLSVLLGKRVEVTLTDNGRVMMSVRRHASSVAVRLHHMFAHANEATLRAVAQYCRRRTADATRVLDEFIELHTERIRARARNTTIVTTGEHHDLRAMFDDIDRAWFEGKTDARITWGIQATRRRRHSIRLGTYAERERLIRIHPLLDQDWVPDYVVRTVVFHEMLHAALPPKIVGRKKYFHTREFRERERAFPDYARATAWEEKNLRRLLRRRWI